MVRQNRLQTSKNKEGEGPAHILRNKTTPSARPPLSERSTPPRGSRAPATSDTHTSGQVGVQGCSPRSLEVAAPPSRPL
eukprot:scaffold12457_cov112-Isochrysis_galbana.AAC.1